MRAVHISVSRAGKSRTALLGTHTAPCDAILAGSVAFKHPSNLEPEKQKFPKFYPGLNTILCIILVFFFKMTNNLLLFALKIAKLLSRIFVLILPLIIVWLA